MEYIRSEHYDHVRNDYGREMVIPSEREWIEVKRGRWRMQRVGEHDEYCVCSECGNQTESDEAWNYCPNCGAIMEEKK